jgi:hypothetical protein
VAALLDDDEPGVEDAEPGAEDAPPVPPTEAEPDAEPGVLEGDEPLGEDALLELDEPGADELLLVLSAPRSHAARPKASATAAARVVSFMGPPWLGYERNSNLRARDNPLIVNGLIPGGLNIFAERQKFLLAGAAGAARARRTLGCRSRRGRAFALRATGATFRRLARAAAGARRAGTARRGAAAGGAAVLAVAPRHQRATEGQRNCRCQCRKFHTHLHGVVCPQGSN